jgi:hypothetical protein
MPYAWHNPPVRAWGSRPTKAIQPSASFNARRQDFVDLRAHVDSRFEQVDRGFQQVDRGFIEMRGKLDATAAGQQRIVELIESLIDQQSR